MKASVITRKEGYKMEHERVPQQQMPRQAR